MQCWVVIAVLVAVSLAAPFENPADPVAPVAASVVPSNPVTVQEAHEDKNPIVVNQAITNQPIQKPEKIEDDHPILNNLNLPEAKPILDNNEKVPVVVDNIKPEANVPPPVHHVQEHVLNERPEKPILQPVEHKPELEEDNEDSDESLDLFQALGLLALNYELELLEEIKQLENQNHRNGHKHHQNHGHSNSHYTPNKEDLLCDCNHPVRTGVILPEIKHE